MNKTWHTTLLLFVLIASFNIAGFHFVQKPIYEQKAIQTTELVAQLSLPYLLNKDHLALQAELNRILRIKAMQSVSVVDGNFNAIAKAQHIELINADTQYISRPISVNSTKIGYAQVALGSDMGINSYLIAIALALLITLLVEVFMVFRRSHKGLVNAKELEKLKSQLDEWVPTAVIESEKSEGGKVKSDSCYVLIHFYQLIQWQQRIQPQVAQTVFYQFEVLLHKQLNIYGGTSVGNLMDGSQIIRFEGNQAQQRCFSFSSGLVYVLASSLHKLPLPLSALLLPEPPNDLSNQSLLSLPKYQQMFESYCQQLDTLHQYSDSNHLIIESKHQSLFEQHASFSDTPISNLSLITPFNATLSLWKRQLERLQQD